MVLPQNLHGGNLADNKSSLRLHAVGPRVTMRRMKIEEDLLSGEVLYHDYIQKNVVEVEKQRKKGAAKKRIKELQQKKQEDNNKKKEVEKIEHKTKTSGGKLTDHDRLLLKDAEEAIEDNSDEDDTRYYQETVGAVPEKELFEGQSSSRKRPFIPKGRNYSLKPKKPRLDRKKDHEDDERDQRRSFNKNVKGKFKDNGGSRKGGNFLVKRWEVITEEKQTILERKGKATKKEKANRLKVIRIRT